MCERLGEWPWSSHLATIGARPAGFLALEGLLSYFGESRDEGQARYLTLVESAEDPFCSEHPLVTGEEDFVVTHLQRVRASLEYPRAALQPSRQPLAELVTSTRDAAAIAHAHLEHDYSMCEIASHLGCGIATVHRRVRSYEATTRGTWKT